LSWRLLGVLLAPALVLGCATRTTETTTTDASPATGELQEVSMSVGAADVRPFLERVARHIDSGFGGPEIAQVEELIRGLDVDEDGQLDFSVLHQGRNGPLTIVVKLEDAGAPDLHFFAAPALASSIQDEMQASAGARRP